MQLNMVPLAALPLAIALAAWAPAPAHAQSIAPEQRGVCPVFFCFREHLERVECGSSRAAKNPHYNRRIIANKLLKRFRAEVGNLEENRARADTGDEEIH